MLAFGIFAYTISMILATLLLCALISRSKDCPCPLCNPNDISND